MAMSSEKAEEPSGRWPRMSSGEAADECPGEPGLEATGDGPDDAEHEDRVRDGIADLQVWDNGELSERSHHGERRGDDRVACGDSIPGWRADGRAQDGGGRDDGVTARSTRKYPTGPLAAAMRRSAYAESRWAADARAPAPPVAGARRASRPADVFHVKRRTARRAVRGVSRETPGKHAMSRR